jgi:hypothetical protein
MGYRSDVTALVYVNDDNLNDVERIEKYEALKLLMRTAFKHIDDDWSSDMEFHDTRQMLVFEIEDVKWYPGYDAVQQFDEFLDKLQDAGYEYEFGRIGEDVEDIEYTRSPNNDYRLDVVRRFSW